jgi:CRISPR system Cascade subunit CasA
VNLVIDPWLPFRLRSGEEMVLPISAICDPDVVDFALPRADFQGAAYQFAIGLLQTVFAPEDRFDWKDFYTAPPTRRELQSAFNKVEHAFNVTGEGPLFMQDFDTLSDAKEVPVAGLLIDAPGGNALKLNTDHFVKRDSCNALSLEMATLALFTLQINAPSGGQGHRTGLRGGGPLTTLVMPQNDHKGLWRILWLNIINREYYKYPDPDLFSADLFPWLGKTKTSDKKGTETYQSDVHELHMYWAMPRRIRLTIKEEACECSVSGKDSQHSVLTFRTLNYGYNYAGTWSHPLTPYKWFPETPEKEHLSLKGQPGGITYKIWDALTLSGESKNGKEGQLPARTVKAYSSLFSEKVFDMTTETPRLWVFGYDMDKMKARCWYSVAMPLFAVESVVQEEVLIIVKELQELAENCLWQCRTQLKSAWFEMPDEAKGDFSFIDLAFWQRTEAQFFKTVQSVIENSIDGDPELTPGQAEDWLKALRSVVTDIFDEFALTELGSERSTAKRIKARRALSGWLYGAKQIKNFINENQIDSLKEVD